jgi:hypothetical protein
MGDDKSLSVCVKDQSTRSVAFDLVEQFDRTFDWLIEA